MPRKNHTPPHTRYQSRSAAAPEKKRFPSRAAALRAITELRKYNLDLELDVYQSPSDGGWYVTSHKPDASR